ncbi:MAG: hypothetical protein AAF492_03740 [Verrucomicrobiota bacterium]
MNPVQSSTQQILRTVTGEIMEHAHLVAFSLLAGVLRSLFRVERATEFSGLKEFDLDDDPARIATNRISPAQWEFLPAYVANGDILTKQYTPFMDYEFIFVADLTPSMGYRWRDVYLGTPGHSDNNDFLFHETGRPLEDFTSTKLYILKYLIYAFLLAATHLGLRCRILFFGLDNVITFKGSTAEFPHQALMYVDEYFLDPRNPNRWEAQDVFASPYERVLLELLEHRRESVVVLASDFMDLVHGTASTDRLEPWFAELKAQHRFAVLQLNDPHEVNTVLNQDDHPTSNRWAFQRNVEMPNEGGIGQQRYYRPAARNAEFVRQCREILGPDDRPEGRLADLVAGQGITLQKFVYGTRGTRTGVIEEQLQQIAHWTREA